MYTSDGRVDWMWFFTGIAFLCGVILWKMRQIWSPTSSTAPAKVIQDSGDTDPKPSQKQLDESPLPAEKDIAAIKEMIVVRD